MANKMTVALTQEQFREIIETMRSGGAGFRPNDRIATCLVLEANLGLRIDDILNLHLSDFLKDGGNYRLNIIEQKTHKKRTFFVPLEIYQFVCIYCMERNISAEKRIFPITPRTVQKYLKKVTDFIGYENIGTHSFRKFFATELYETNDHDIELVRELLQHTSTVTTQRYIKRSSKTVEEAIRKHVFII